MFEIRWTDAARLEFDRLDRSPAEAARFRAVGSAIAKLATNPRHPGLNTHAFKGTTCPHGDTLWEAYAQNNTPSAYRIFFCYPPAPPQPPSPPSKEKGKKQKKKPDPPPPPPKLILLVSISAHRDVCSNGRHIATNGTISTNGVRTLILVEKCVACGHGRAECGCSL